MSRPARELLAYLALHPGMHPRLELAMRFWPDVPEASARASLRTTLHELRRALGDAASHLAVDRERVGLTDVTVDLLELLVRGNLVHAGGPLAGYRQGLGPWPPATSIAIALPSNSRGSPHGPDGSRAGRARQSSATRCPKRPHVA